MLAKVNYGHPDAGEVLTGTAMLRSCATGQCTHTLADHAGELNSARMSQDGTSLLTSANDKTAKLWDLATGDCVRTFPDMTLRVLGFRSEIFWEKATLPSRGMTLYGYADHDFAHCDCPLVIWPQPQGTICGPQQTSVHAA